jgi:predicted nucleotidyltransferase
MDQETGKGNAMLKIDEVTKRTGEAFVAIISSKYDLAGAVLFGSRARHTHSQDSDADIAVVLHGVNGDRTETAIAMAGIAFDVMMETGVLVDALPLWEEEFEHPEKFSNPELIANIRREGIRL